MSMYVIDSKFDREENCDKSITEITSKTEAIEIGTSVMIRTTIIVENFGSDNRYSSNIDVSSTIIDNMFIYQSSNGKAFVKEYDK